MLAWECVSMVERMQEALGYIPTTANTKPKTPTPHRCLSGLRVGITSSERGNPLCPWVRQPLSEFPGPPHHTGLSFAQTMS
jgi:hypothetical protein